MILLVENYFTTDPPGCFGGRVVIFDHFMTFFIRAVFDTLLWGRSSQGSLSSLGS